MMNENIVTWEGLDQEERDYLSKICEKGEIRSFNRSAISKLWHKGLIERGSMVDYSIYKWKPTEAGQELLPKAGEAVETWTSLTQADLDQLGITREQAEQFDRETFVEKTTLRDDLEAIAHGATGDYTPAGIATWSLTKLDALQTELAAANERAKAAEANIVEMNKVIEMLRSQRDRTREELKQCKTFVNGLHGHEVTD